MRKILQALLIPILSCHLGLATAGQNSTDVVRISLQTNLSIKQYSIPGLTSVEGIDSAGDYAIAWEEYFYANSLENTHLAMFDGERWSAVKWPTDIDVSVMTQDADRAILGIDPGNNGIELWLRARDSKNNLVLKHYENQRWQTVFFPHALSTLFEQPLLGMIRNGDDLYFIGESVLEGPSTLMHAVYNRKSKHWSSARTQVLSDNDDSVIIDAAVAKHNIILETATIDKTNWRNLNNVSLSTIDPTNTFREINLPGGNALEANTFFGSDKFSIISDGSHYFINNDVGQQSWRMIANTAELPLGNLASYSVEGDSLCLTTSATMAGNSQGKFYCVNVNSATPAWHANRALPVDAEHPYGYVAARGSGNAWYGNLGICSDGVDAQSCSIQPPSVGLYDAASDSMTDLQFPASTSKYTIAYPILHTPSKLLMQKSFFNSFTGRPEAASFYYYDIDHAGQGWQLLTLPVTFSSMEADTPSDWVLPTHQVWIYQQSYNDSAAKRSVVRHKGTVLQQLTGHDWRYRLGRQRNVSQKGHVIPSNVGDQ